MTFDLKRLFVGQVGVPPLPERLTNCLDVLDGVVPISRDDAPIFNLFDVLSVERFNQLFPFDDLSIRDSGDAVEPVKRSRRRTLTTALKQAAKAGVTVSGATIAPDGTISIVIDRPGITSHGNDNDRNEWDTVQ